MWYPESPRASPGGRAHAQLEPSQRGRRWRRRARRVLARLKGKPPQGIFEPVATHGQLVAESLQPTNLFRHIDPMPVLRYPPMVPAGVLELPGDSYVLGVESNADARLYPIATIRRHHVINDRLDGVPIAVTFCPKCFAGIALDARMNGKTLTFDVFGLYHGSMVMRDAETGTVWDRFTGEGLMGPLAGKRLSMIPTHLGTFAHWIAAHPQTVAPDPAASVAPRALRPAEMVLDPNVRATFDTFDDRLSARQLVLGVRLGETARAYPLGSQLGGSSAMNDDVDGVAIVLLAIPGAWPLAYERSFEGKTLEFRPEGDHLLDQDGRAWSYGAASREGSRLRFVPSLVTEWFAWSATHPGTEVAAQRGNRPDEDGTR